MLKRREIKRGRRPKHPWAKWFKQALKGACVLRRGRDFDCLPHGMAQQIRQNAIRRNLSVVMHVEENKLWFTCEGKNGQSKE